MSMHLAALKHAYWFLPVALTVSGAALYFELRTGPEPTEASPLVRDGKEVPPAIGCLGRIEPDDGIVRVGARSLSGQPSIVRRLTVREGATVHSGQVLGELDSHAALKAAQRAAVARIEVARTRLAQVQAGAKPSEIAAQRSLIERLQAELENARIEYRRNETLGDVVSASQRDAARLRVDTTVQSLQQARETLASLTEVRPVDVAVARAELHAAIGEEARAVAEYEASLIRSPIDGRVIKIFAWPGEEVSTEGVMELARTDPMFVVAEVAESDLSRVRPGQRARISGAGLPSAVRGTVDRIGLKVLQNQLLPLDPANFSDGRVVEVWIKLDDSRPVANLIHLRVDVIIQP